MNITGYYYLEVLYRGVKLINQFGGRNYQWFWVDVDPITGITRDLQWSF
jgi:hypothetical protein